MQLVQRVFLIILDGCGIGALPDADAYGDAGAATLPNVARAAGGLHLPVLESLGLGSIVPLAGVAPVPTVRDCRPWPDVSGDFTAAIGRMMMKSPGKDTTTGHWEIAGITLPQPFPLYPAGFPPEITGPFKEKIGRGILGNKPASGTEIIRELGREHLKTGHPIIYTSADSVFQIAAHEEKVPVEQLYEWCAAARALLTGEHNVSRVIARPFTGEPGNFTRTHRRKDYSLPPPGNTMLDDLYGAGLETCVIGKISDIFSGRGITRHLPVKGGNAAVARNLQKAAQLVHRGLIWANFNDFDTLYGHRNDPAGFAAALQEFDTFLGTFITGLTSSPAVDNGKDLVVITADHGCDPTWPGTDHTREYVPLMVISPPVPDTGRDGLICHAGSMESMAELGKSVLSWLA